MPVPPAIVRKENNRAANHSDSRRGFFVSVGEPADAAHTVWRTARQRARGDGATPRADGRKSKSGFAQEAFAARFLGGAGLHVPVLSGGGGFAHADFAGRVGQLGGGMIENLVGVALRGHQSAHEEAAEQQPRHQARQGGFGGQQTEG